ncbi:MAG: HPP family protein [Myxococcales bacterium]|nr:HPP family protein [Myxococcales bacterium]
MTMTKTRSEFLIKWIARLARIQPWYLMVRYPNRWTRSLFAFVNGGVSILIMAAMANYSHQPLLFPSLGPRAFLFFSQPSAAAASPRNAVLGHGLGALIGWVCFVVFDIDTAFGGIAAIAVSLSLISAVMIATNLSHPPAASTALMVSMGLIHGGAELVAIIVAVALLAAQAFVFNRLSGISYPVWAPRAAAPAEGFVPLALETDEAATPSDPYAAVWPTNWSGAGQSSDRAGISDARLRSRFLIRTTTRQSR